MRGRLRRPALSEFGRPSLRPAVLSVPLSSPFRRLLRSAPFSVPPFAALPWYQSRGISGPSIFFHRCTASAPIFRPIRRPTSLSKR